MEVENKSLDDELELPVKVLSTADVWESFNKLTYRRPRVARIVQLWLTGCYSTAEIAENVDVSKDTVQKWLRRAEVKAYIEAHQAESLAMLKTKMLASTDKAFDNVVRLLESELDNVSLQASKDILDRTGFKPANEVKQDITIKTYEENLKDIISMTISDVEYVEVDDEVE